MAIKERTKKKRQPVFGEEIDSAINGFAVGISFTGIGVFLLMRPDYFAVPIISYVIGAVIGVIGVVGTGFELSKYSRVKGLDNMTAGMVFLALWALAYIRVHALWLNILAFFLLLFGCYSVCLGLIQGVVSIAKNVRESRKDTEKSKFTGIGSALTQIVLFLTQLCGLLLAIINVLKAIST